MSADRFDQPEERPAVEVRVYRYGDLIHRELCESEEEAAGVVGHWSDLDGIECEVDDLSAHHGFDDILESEPLTPGDELYGRPSGSEEHETYR